MQIPAVVLTSLSSIPAATPEGLPTADKWPVLQTIGVFVGIPVAAGLVITALVVLQAMSKRPGRPAGVAAVFTGPHAGEVDARGGEGRLSRGTGPRTESGEHSGQHREVAQPGGGGGREQGGMFSDLLSATGQDPDLVARARAGDGPGDAAQDSRPQPADAPDAGDDAGSRPGAFAVGADSGGAGTGGSGARW